MMTIRCNNCGWDNADNEHMCIKCNAQLVKNKVSSTPPPPQSAPRRNSYFGGTIQGKQVKSDSIDNREVNMNPTVQDFQKVEASENRMVNPTVPDFQKAGVPENKLKPETITCPDKDCGFINVAPRKTCIKCQRDLTKTSEENTIEDKNIEDKKNEDKKPGALNDPTVKPNLFTGTIDPYRNQPKNVQSCYIELVPKGGELPLLSQKFNFEAEDIKLNRSNIDPQNSTITSKIQAELSFENGKWFLIDKSDQQTTFIRASAKTEIKDGDMILMGDRKMIFSLENTQELQK